MDAHLVSEIRPPLGGQEADQNLGPKKIGLNIGLKIGLNFGLKSGLNIGLKLVALGCSGPQLVVLSLSACRFSLLRHASLRAIASFRFALCWCQSVDFWHVCLRSNISQGPLGATSPTGRVDVWQPSGTSDWGPCASSLKAVGPFGSTERTGLARPLTPSTPSERKQRRVNARDPQRP